MVSVKTTVFPASNEDGVYVGVNVVPFARVPLPLCVHEMVPFAEDAPLTVAELLTQMTEVPPAFASGACCTVIAD
ncbi:hypothetical protein D3C80_1684260 [compost metagenome]